MQGFPVETTARDGNCQIFVQDFQGLLYELFYKSYQADGNFIVREILKRTFGMKKKVKHLKLLATIIC
jgi:hypothetical protein